MVREGQVKYYTVKVPLQVQNCDEGVKGVEANWLDHMTQHFSNGASLVDGYFHLGNVNGKPSWHSWHYSTDHSEFMLHLKKQKHLLCSAAHTNMVINVRTCLTKVVTFYVDGVAHMIAVTKKQLMFLFLNHKNKYQKVM